MGVGARCLFALYWKYYMVYKIERLLIKRSWHCLLIYCQFFRKLLNKGSAMFGFFNHPKPVNPSRPVAEFNVQQKVNAQSKSILLISENNRVPPAELVPSTGTISAPITFTVRYKFTE